MRIAIVVAVLAVLSLFAVLALAQDAEQPRSILWWTDLEAARADAAKSGRPLLVVFR